MPSWARGSLTRALRKAGPPTADKLPAVRTLVWASGPALAALALVGLVHRRRVRRAYCLPPLLLALIASSTFVAIAPDLYTWKTWLIKESLHVLVLAALGIELSTRMFRNLPGAAAWARGLSAMVGLAIGLLVYAAPRDRGVVTDLSVTILPLLVGGVALLYTAIALVTAYFLIPEDPLHKAVLSSFPLYLILYCVWTAEMLHEPARAVVDGVLPLVLVLVLANLTWVAWRREEPPRAPAALLRFLWPWR